MTMQKPESPILVLRRARDLRQVDLAIRADLSPTTVSLAERGFATAETLAKIASVLGVAIEELQP